MIDSLCFVGSHPFRKIDLVDIRSLSEFMANIGFKHLLVANLSAIFYRNPWVANMDLLSEKRKTSGVKTRVDLIAGLNPEYAVTRDRVAQLGRDFKAVLISPLHHGFKLSSRLVKNLVDYTYSENLALVVFGYLEDPREMHRAYRFRYKLGYEDFKMFLNYVKNAGHRRVALFSQPLDLLAKLYREITEVPVYVDISSDTVYGPVYDYVKALVENIGEDLVVFASKAPLTYAKSVLFKALYSDIPEGAKKKILCENATKLFNLT